MTQVWLVSLLKQLFHLKSTEISLGLAIRSTVVCSIVALLHLKSTEISLGLAIRSTAICSTAISSSVALFQPVVERRTSRNQPSSRTRRDVGRRLPEDAQRVGDSDGNTTGSDLL